MGCGTPNDSIRKGGPFVVSLRRSRSPSISARLCSHCWRSLGQRFAAAGRLFCFAERKVQLLVGSSLRDIDVTTDSSSRICHSIPLMGSDCLGATSKQAASHGLESCVQPLVWIVAMVLFGMERSSVGKHELFDGQTMIYTAG